MTPTEALYKLHAAGKTAQWFLDGMLAQLPLYRATQHDPGIVRLGATFGDADHEIMSHWANGHCGHWKDDERYKPETWPQPILTDPATVGCLLSLLREASADPFIHVIPATWGGRWRVVTSEGPMLGPGRPGTDGEALAAALVTLAESINPEPSEAA